MERILFVCLGNICRSPAGESILRHLVEKEGLSKEIEVDSCGIGDWHIGEQAHPEMRKKAKVKGYILDGRAKKFHRDFFKSFDYILAAEKSVYDHLVDLTDDSEEKSKIHMLTDFSEKYTGTDVPDPYFGGEKQYAETLGILEHICHEFLYKHILNR